MTESTLEHATDASALITDGISAVGLAVPHIFRIIKQLHPLDMLVSKAVSETIDDVGSACHNYALFKQKPGRVFVLVCPYAQVSMIKHGPKRTASGNTCLNSLKDLPEHALAALANSYENYMLSVLMQNTIIYENSRGFYLLLNYNGDSALSSAQRHYQHHSEIWPVTIGQICQTCAPTLETFAIMALNRRGFLPDVAGAQEILMLQREIIPRLLLMHQLETLILPDINVFITAVMNEDVYRDFESSLPLLTDEQLCDAIFTDSILPRLHTLYFQSRRRLQDYHEILPHIFQYEFIGQGVTKIILYGGSSMVKSWSEAKQEAFRDAFPNASVFDDNLVCWELGRAKRRLNTIFDLNAESLADCERILSWNYSNKPTLKVTLSVQMLNDAVENSPYCLPLDVIEKHLEHIVAYGSSKWRFVFKWHSNSRSPRPVTWEQAQSVLKYWQTDGAYQMTRRPTPKLSFDFYSLTLPNVLLESWTSEAEKVFAAQVIGDSALAGQFLNAGYANIGRHCYTYEVKNHIPFDVYKAYDMFYGILVHAVESNDRALREERQTLASAFYNNLKRLEFHVYSRKEANNYEDKTNFAANSDQYTTNEDKLRTALHEAQQVMMQIVLGLMSATMPALQEVQNMDDCSAQCSSADALDAAMNGMRIDSPVTNFVRYCELIQSLAVDGCYRALPSLTMINFWVAC